jgi:hypothetical protein
MVPFCPVRYGNAKIELQCGTRAAAQDPSRKEPVGCLPPSTQKRCNTQLRNFVWSQASDAHLSTLDILRLKPELLVQLLVLGAMTRSPAPGSARLSRAAVGESAAPRRARRRGCRQQQRQRQRFRPQSHESRSAAACSLSRRLRSLLRGRPDRPRSALLANRGADAVVDQAIVVLPPC